MKESLDKAEKGVNFILDYQQRLSRCLLWKIQRGVFEAQGVAVWRQGIVPHYITNSPFIASAFGKLIFGFLRDYHSTADKHQHSDFHLLDKSQPVYIIELGAGSGRFAFHFLKKFLNLLSRSVFKDTPFTYVLTDLAERNLDFWRTHASLQPFVEQGLLDFARFDAEQDQEIKLINAGLILSAETIKNPLVVLANYFFDSIPQDAFHIRNGQLHESLITISSTQEEPDLNDPELLGRIEIAYDDHPVTADYYEDPDLNCILHDYQQRLTDTSLLFPCAALRCISRLRHLSGGRMLLISADKGYISEESLLGRGAPKMWLHGSFSMMVNYHAIGQYILNQGGRVLRTSHHNVSINVCAFLLGNHPADYMETRQAYDEAVEKGGPDDFYTLIKGIEKNYEALTVEQLLAYLRLSGWDAKLFLDCFPALLNKVESASELSQQKMCSAIKQVWDNYYHIGEEHDLAFNMAMLLYGMQYYPEALEYFEHSLRLWGADPSTLYNMAMCHYSLRQLHAALECINQTLELDPTFEAAKAMRIKLQSETGQ